MLVRETTEDVAIKVSRPTEQTIVFKKGSRVIIDMIAAREYLFSAVWLNVQLKKPIDRDPHLFPEAEKFRPERWHDAGDRDVTAFGVGPRACIGQKFAMAEAMCFLVMFLRDWKLDVELNDGETRDAYEDRAMIGGRVGLGWGVLPFDIKLTRRFNLWSLPNVLIFPSCSLRANIETFLSRRSGLGEPSEHWQSRIYSWEHNMSLFSSRKLKQPPGRKQCQSSSERWPLG